VAEFIAWVLVVVFGAGSAIALAGSGHMSLAWGSTLSTAAFLAGTWYLPSRAGRGALSLPEWLLTLSGAAGWLACWVWSLKP
jgi:hypothetical protein